MNNKFYFSETVESEMKKLEEAALQIDRSSSSSVMPPLQPLKVIQSVKCIINLMGDLCTLDIMQTVEALMEFCRNFIPSNVSISNNPNENICTVSCFVGGQFLRDHHQ